MTALGIIRRRLGLRPRVRLVSLETGAILALILVAIAAALMAFRPSASEPSVATVQIPSAKAAALVAATSASAVEFRAVGDRAKLINASLPFSTSPVQAARPFEIAGDPLDYRRALLCLTQAVYYEAGFEPATGRRAVAQVVLNRMRHPAFPKSVCGVVYQGSSSPVCQFSFVCDGSLYRAPAASAWRQAQEVAREALAGYVERSVGSATHYHADYVAPRWAPMLTKITKLGAHIFYRWPGGWGQSGAFTGRYIGEPQDPMALRPAYRPADPETAIADAVATGPITDGTQLKRAPTDVGGLLDVSKGWTLSIPMPNEARGATGRALAQQQASAVAPAAPASAATIATASPVIASR
ncbi:MAG TPA: cell wall hydrolase [Sphingomicrobium sp.]|nr:cell wall hydrolase [Sphingomicrobium sp.]